METLIYNSYKRAVQAGEIDVLTDSVYALLVTSAYVPDRDSHSSRADGDGLPAPCRVRP